MDRRRVALGVAMAIGFMLVVQVGGLLLVTPFEAAGYEAVEDGTDPAYGAALFAVVLVATVLLLLAMRYGLQSLIRAMIVGVSGLLGWYVASVAPFDVGVAGVDIFPLGVAAAVILALAVHPEWYVIDATALLVGAGAAGMFGLSFTVLPIVILLVVLAVYDAISVYGTRHMLTLAEGAMTMNLPVLVVIPLSRKFSVRHLAEAPPEQASGEPDEPEERNAIFLGLGDLVIPSILVVSAAFHGIGGGVVTVAGLDLGWAVLGAVGGSILGLAGLLALVERGGPQAGLPLLNGGVLLGYLLGALLDGVDLLTAVGL
ncbi:MAG: presenilin family intramembrane aspartyl protease PSH [Halobacteriales archaeon]